MDITLIPDTSDEEFNEWIRKGLVWSRDETFYFSDELAPLGLDYIRVVFIKAMFGTPIPKREGFGVAAAARSVLKRLEGI